MPTKTSVREALDAILMKGAKPEDITRPGPLSIRRAFHAPGELASVVIDYAPTIPRVFISWTSTARTLLEARQALALYQKMVKLVAILEAEIQKARLKVQ